MRVFCYSGNFICIIAAKKIHKIAGKESINLETSSLAEANINIAKPNKPSEIISFAISPALVDFIFLYCYNLGEYEFLRKFVLLYDEKV